MWPFNWVQLHPESHQDLFPSRWVAWAAGSPQQSVGGGCALPWLLSNAGPFLIWPESICPSGTMISYLLGPPGIPVNIRITVVGTVRAGATLGPSTRVASC